MSWASQINRNPGMRRLASELKPGDKKNVVMRVTLVKGEN